MPTSLPATTVLSCGHSLAPLLGKQINLAGHRCWTEDLKAARHNDELLFNKTLFVQVSSSLRLSVHLAWDWRRAARVEPEWMKGWRECDAMRCHFTQPFLSALLLDNFIPFVQIMSNLRANNLYTAAAPVEPYEWVYAVHKASGSRSFAFPLDRMKDLISAAALLLADLM